MVDDNMNRVYWIIAVLVIVGVIGTALFSPIYNKISAQQNAITNTTYTAP